MPKLASRRILDHPAERIYRLVMDAERYPHLLSHIRSVHIVESSPDARIAEVAVAAGPLSFTYRCRIAAVPFRSIRITGLTGPFRHLRAGWEFTPLPDGRTQVDYTLDSAFESRWMEMLGGAVFAQQLHQAMSAFEAALRTS